MSHIALLGKRTSAPSWGIAPRASCGQVILTIAPIAPITQACFAIEAIQRLSVPLHCIPTPRFPHPLFFRLSVSHQSIQVLIVRAGLRCLFRRQPSIGYLPRAIQIIVAC